MCYNTRHAAPEWNYSATSALHKIVQLIVIILLLDRVRWFPNRSKLSHIYELAQAVPWELELRFICGSMIVCSYLLQLLLWRLLLRMASLSALAQASANGTV